MDYASEMSSALVIVRKAGELALQHFNRNTRAEEKKDSSPVTVADRECERLISQLLLQDFPGDGIAGEEGAFRPSDSGRRWIIDPIDGTRDFVRHTSFWSVQLALQNQAQVALGIIHFPCSGDTLYAASGLGCFWNGQRTAASDIVRLEKAILMVSGFKSAWDSWAPESVRYLTQNCWTVRCYGGSYDVAMLARGKADIWLSGNGMEWDYAPARIIAQECGALFLTRDGGDRIDANHCVVFAPGLERELRRTLGIPAQIS